MNTNKKTKYLTPVFGLIGVHLCSFVAFLAFRSLPKKLDCGSGGDNLYSFTGVFSLNCLAVTGPNWPWKGENGNFEQRSFAGRRSKECTGTSSAATRGSASPAPPGKTAPDRSLGDSRGGRSSGRRCSLLLENPVGVQDRRRRPNLVRSHHSGVVRACNRRGEGQRHRGRGKLQSTPGPPHHGQPDGNEPRWRCGIWWRRRRPGRRGWRGR